MALADDTSAASAVGGGSSSHDVVAAAAVAVCWIASRRLITRALHLLTVNARALVTSNIHGVLGIFREKVGFVMAYRYLLGCATRWIQNFASCIDGSTDGGSRNDTSNTNGDCCNHLGEKQRGNSHNFF